MNKNTTSLHLFQAFGVELEYMIVDRDTLNVKPIADELLKDVLGAYGNDYVNRGNLLVERVGFACDRDQKHSSYKGYVRAGAAVCRQHQRD